MKKSLITLLVVSFVLGLAGTAMAFPVDFSGSINLGYANWSDKVGIAPDPAADGHNDFRSSIKLNFSSQIDQDVTLFGRLAERTFSDTKSVNHDPDSNILDQFGVKIANNGWNYTLGRQGVNLGQGTIISTGNGIAYDARFDGLVAAGKLGAIDTKFIAGKTTENAAAYASIPSFVSDNAANAKNVWGLDFSTAVTSNLNFGATYASIANQGDTTSTVPGATVSSPAVKYLGVNAAFNPTANLAFNAEYVKSNLDTNNKAYFVAGTYSWDKDWFMIQYQNVGINGSDVNVGGISAYWYPINGAGLAKDIKYTGWTYDYNHQMSKAAALNICYETFKTPNQPGTDNELCTGVTWSF